MTTAFPTLGGCVMFRSMRYALKVRDKEVIVSDHAMRRFMQRCKSTKPARSLNSIYNLVANAVPITKTKWYGNGWVFVLIGKLIVTIYRPLHAALQAQITDACLARQKGRA